jgi:ssDNA-binding Zn-finger/Zn-ribbon topoisomerase 1
MDVKLKCEKCGSKLEIREKRSGDKNGLRYLVCSKWPKCNYKRGYAEMGKEHKWILENGKIR